MRDDTGSVHFGGQCSRIIDAAEAIRLVPRAIARSHVLGDITVVHCNLSLEQDRRGKRIALYSPLVLDANYRPDTFSHQHASAMHWATWGGHTEIVKLLLEHKVGVVSISSYLAANTWQEMWTLIFLSSPHDDVILFFVQVSLDESDEQDGTPLHYAAKKGFVGLAKVLVGAGATIDVRNVKNMTPLHLVRPHLAGLIISPARYLAFWVVRGNGSRFVNCGPFDLLQILPTTMLGLI